MTKGNGGAPSLIDELRGNLRKLKLHAMLAHLDEALEQAQTLQQGYATFVSGLIEKQVLAVAESFCNNRVKAAGFPVTRTFDTFDWVFQPGLNVQLVKDLMTLDFVQQARPVLMLGKPGTGKTHMSIAYGHLAALAGKRVLYRAASKLLADLYASLADGTTDKLVARLGRYDLLIIDDLREVPPRPEYASLLYDVIEVRHGKKATIVTSNLSVNAWGHVLGNPTLVASLVDRLMERAHVINIKPGRSYRTHGPDAPPIDDHPEGLVRTDG